jgi:meckelin
VWNFVFLERYYKEPRSQIFVDLCTMAKISVFIMDEPYHGYYLHCRSPYEYADGSMQQLAEQLKKEESGLTTDRGLDAAGAPRGCQTFELFTSPTFRSQFDKVYQALNQSNSAALAQDTGRLGHMVGRAGGKGRAPPAERMVTALKELNLFLQAFVEQSPPPAREELKRIVREPPFFDQIIGNPPADIRAQNAKCVFYPDTKTWLHDNAFLTVTFMGIETDLLVHNILAFNVFDMTFGNSAISIMLTYLTHIFFVWLRGSFGQGNLANKTLVDDKFLI